MFILADFFGHPPDPPTAYIRPLRVETATHLLGVLKWATSCQELEIGL